jgi:hypothetical protein
MGHAIAQLAEALRHHVTGNFHWHHPSGRTMALGSNQPVRKMSTRNISWGVKAVGAYGWRYHLHLPLLLKSESLSLLEPSGPSQACTGISLLFYLCRTQLTLLWADKARMKQISSANKYFVTVIPLLSTSWSLVQTSPTDCVASLCAI